MSFGQWTRRLDDRVVGRGGNASDQPPPWWYWVLVLGAPPSLMLASIALGPWVGLTGLVVYLVIGAAFVVRQRRQATRPTAGA